MLKRIEIRNYAIIDQLQIDFSGRMNIITGETGAGKSILMGALSLILGDRADTGVLLQDDKKCVVEGLFHIPGKETLSLLLKQDELEADDELLIRREISPSGKSRAFINDTPVNLDQLRRISSQLVDLHRQFDTLELGQAGFQREILDALAGNANALQKYQVSFSALQKALQEKNRLHEAKNLFAKESDYNRFLFNELDEAAFAPNELEDAEQELKMLESSEGIKAALTRITTELEEGEQPLIPQLRILSAQLQAYLSLHPALEELASRLNSVQIELKDIAGEVERISDKVQYEPARIDLLNERISVGYRLLKKHGLHTTAELLALKEELEKKLESVLDLEDAIVKIEKEVELLSKQTMEQAAGLSEKRKKQVKPVETKVNHLLNQVGMPNARIRIDINDAALNEFGKDQIEFLFDANKSNRFESIRKVASGGELSRLMLCIKSLVAQSVDLPTMIFDEIDTGISGEAARQVGIIMKDMSADRQLIAITHQPQIAGKADAHFFVYKEAVKSGIKTNIRLLDKNERIEAVAKMLSGEKPTAAALENAKELIG